MAEETDPETQDVEWVLLEEAFNKIGLMKYDVRWDKSTIYLSLGRFKNNMADEELPIRIDHSIKRDYPLEWREYYESLPHEHPFASEEMERHYDVTEGLLFDAIWEGKLNVRALAGDGDFSKVPRKAWKDKTEAFQISFPDSEVRRLKPKGSSETWRISVDPNDLQALMDSVDAERRDAVRRKAANENPNKGGAPSKYDWPMIEQYIAEELRHSPVGIPYSKIARRAAKRLEDEGIDPPHYSQLRARVKKVRELGLK